MVPTSFTKTLAVAMAGVSLAAASLTSQDMSKNLGIPTEQLDELLSCRDFSTIDITKWSGPFHQPLDVVASWPQDLKELALLAASMDLKIVMDLPDDDDAVQKRQVDSYRAEHRRLTQLHEERVKSDKSKCISHFECGACVGIASVVWVGAVAGCTGVALAAEAASVVETFGVSTAPIWLAFTECVAKSAGIYGTAVVGCHKLL